MTRSVFVGKSLRVLIVAAAALALLVPGNALASSGGGGGTSGPTLSQPTSDGKTVTISGSGFTPNGRVDIQIQPCTLTNCEGPYLWWSTTATGFHYVCNNGSCYRVYGDLLQGVPASPWCYPYRAQYRAYDYGTNRYTTWTTLMYVC